MSSSFKLGLSPNPNSSRKSSASHERKEIKKRSRKRKNLLNRYGPSKKRRIAYALNRKKGTTVEAETLLDSPLLEKQILSNRALDSGRKSLVKGFQEASEHHENNKFTGKVNRRRRNDVEVHVDLGMDSRITSCSQAAQLDNAEILCSPASLLPRTNALERVPQLSCDGVQDMSEGRVLRPRRLQGKESKGNFSPPVDSLQIVGRRVKVYWPLDSAWYCGLISAYDDNRKKHKVSYDDGEEEWLCLSHEKFKFEMSFEPDSGQADGTILENKDGKKGCAFRDDSSELGLASLGVVQGVHGKGSSNGSSVPITLPSRRRGAQSLEDTMPQANASVLNVSCIEAIPGGGSSGLKSQKQKFLIQRHKCTPTDQSRGGIDVLGNNEVNPRHVYVRKGRSRTADHQVTEEVQQVESLNRQRWHGRLNCKRKPKISQQNDDAVHLCLNGPSDIKNLDSDAPMHRKHPKLTSFRKRNRQSLKDDGSMTQSSLEESVSILDPMIAGTVKNAGVPVRHKTEQPQRKVKKKHKVKCLAHTTLALEVKGENIETVAKTSDQEQNQKAVEDLAIFMMDKSLGRKHQETEVPGADMLAIETSKRKYNTDNVELQATRASKRLVGRKSRGGRKPTGNHSRGPHKYRQPSTKSPRVQKAISSIKPVSQSNNAYNDNEILVSWNKRFSYHKFASNEVSSTPCKSSMGFHTGIGYSNTAIKSRASCTSDNSVSEGYIMHHWAPHEFTRQHCSNSDLILESDSSQRLQSPLRAFHSTIHFLRRDMVFGLFTWQLFNIMEVVGLFSGNSFEGRFSWMGSIRDLANVVLLFMTIIKSLPLMSKRCHQDWQGRVLYELWSVLLRRKHWVRNLPAILSPEADDLLMQHLRHMVVGHCTSNMTSRQMLNIFSCYVLKPFAIAILCEIGVQLTVVEQRYSLLICPWRESTSFERQSVKGGKLRSHAGAEADFSSYLLSFPTAKHQCPGTYLSGNPNINRINSADQVGYMLEFIPIPSFKFSSNQGLQFTTAMVGSKNLLPRGGHLSLHLQEVAGSFSIGNLTVFEKAREFLQHGRFACFNHFQESQHFYTRLYFNSMLQKCLYLADGKSAEPLHVKGVRRVAKKDTIYKQLSLKVGSIKEEGICDWEVESSPTFKSIDIDSPQGMGRDNLCLESRKAKSKITNEKERFVQNCDYLVDPESVSNTLMGSSQFCSMNDLVCGSSGSSSSSSYEFSTKWKSTKMAEIGFRPLDLRGQHEQSFYGDSSYLSLGQHSQKKPGTKRRPRGAEQESTDMEHLDLCCTANVLITRNNRSWREVGVRIELQSRQSEWVISVQIEGVTHSHKVLESTINSRVNRYTHAMMWKGGDDWTLEFSDRTQWTCFKGMHEECSSRNARAAFVKQIPIPSVKQIQDRLEGKHIDSPRFGVIGGRWPGEVETALNCSTRVYDMDSEDENWLAEVNQRASSDEMISMDVFERIIDKLERITYLRQGEMVVTDEVAELCENLASENAVLLVHAYWFDKRLMRENALIRYFESPLWRKYQKQCDCWEARINELQQLFPHENKEELERQYPKPPLFAFCFPSRGLDASNSSKRVQRQRSQKHLNSSFKYMRTSLFETPEESHRASLLKSPRGHDLLSKYQVSQFHPSSVSAYEKGDFWQKKMSRDGFFEQLLTNLSPDAASLVGHRSLENVQANAAAARELAQMYLLRFNSALQRAVAAVIEFETIYFTELAVINLKCESAMASSEQLLFFRRRIEHILNQFFSLSSKDLLNGDGNQGGLSDDGGEAIADDEDDDPLYTIGVQADGFGGSPISDDFLREEGSFLSISERAHLESWMRTTLRQRAS